MSRGRPGAFSPLRELNRLKVLEVLRERGAVSRAEIVATTGLSRSTVSAVVGELQNAGVVIEREGEGPPTMGRPPLLLSIDPGAGAVIGIHFGHDFIRVAIADLAFELLAIGTRQADVDHDAQAGLVAAAELAERLRLEPGVTPDRILGAGVALSGPIDSANGMVSSTTILPGWVGVNAAEWLGERLGVEVYLENDANLGALAESVLGAGRGCSELVYVMLSSGVGGGLILEGRLYRGARGNAGEFGHISVDQQGPICRCGNRGCLETLVGAGALLELLRRSHGPGLTLEKMLELATHGDPGCQRVIADAGRIVGRVLAGTCNEFNPERIVIGGELAIAGEVLLAPIREAIALYAQPGTVEGLTVVAGELADRAELMGALALVVVGHSSRVLSGRVHVAAGG